MKDIIILLEQANNSLNDKLAQLKILETEKQEILQLYEKSKPANKMLLQIEMKKSVDKFKKLCDDVFILSEKIKELKKHYC